MEGRSLNNELLYQSGCAINTPTSSAFIQQRNKISYKAFESLFHDFIRKATKDGAALFNGYRLLADMIDRADDTHPSIVIADCGYESYNVLAHVQEKTGNFLYV